MTKIVLHPTRLVRVGAAARLTRATEGPFKELSGVGRQIGA